MHWSLSGNGKQKILIVLMFIVSLISIAKQMIFHNDSKLTIGLIFMLIYMYKKKCKIDVE